MDQINTKDMDTELDLERGLVVTEDSKKENSPDTAKHEKSLFSKVSGGLIGGSTVIEDRASLSCNDSSLNGIAVNLVDVTKNLLVGQDPVDTEKTLVKEQHKKASKKKPPKPPRPPRSPPLDAADQKLISELSELALLKRTRVERMKALKKMRASKPSSSSSSILATIFTIIFFIVIIVQGMSSGESSVVSVQGSPLPTGGAGA